MIVLDGCGVGLVDESITVMLPTRECEGDGLVKDWVGIAMAVGVVMLIGNRTVGNR